MNHGRVLQTVATKVRRVDVVEGVRVRGSMGAQSFDIRVLDCV